MPSATDIAMQYPDEMSLGKQALQMINAEMKIGLGKEEAVSLALHFLNAEDCTPEGHGSLHLNRETISENVVKLIEDYFSISIDRESFNCSRFLNHLSYLLSRIEQGTPINSDNSRMFLNAVSDYPEAYACAMRIRAYFSETLSYELADEDVLYLMLHINRLCTREA